MDVYCFELILNRITVDKNTEGSIVYFIRVFIRVEHKLQNITNKIQ